MHFTPLGLAGFLLLSSQVALAQDDEPLIDDLPRAFKQDAAVRAKQKSKQPQNPKDDVLPPVMQKNTDLIDDLPPERKRAAGHRAEAPKIENAIPDNLGEALARALHSSPAILVAEAKVRQAQAELNEVRQTVVHDLTLAFKRRARNNDLLPQGSEKVRDAVLEDEAKILYLLGAVGEARLFSDFTTKVYPLADLVVPPAGPSAVTGDKTAPEEHRKPGAVAQKTSPGNAQAMAGMMSAMMGTAAAPRAVAGSSSLDNLPENVRSFLSKRIDLDFTNQPVQDVLDYIKAAGGGDIDFVVQNPELWAADTSQPEGSDNFTVSVSIKRVTVAAALQALADLKGCAFVFRDYGILAMPPGGDGYSLESYRASGAPMIAPPLELMGGRVSPGTSGFGMGMRMMGGMMKPDGTGDASPESPAGPPAEQ